MVDFKPIQKSEIVTILNSSTPNKDLKVNSDGIITKRNIFSKALYFLGYKVDQSDTKLKRRVGEIVDQLMTDVEDEGAESSKQVWTQLKREKEIGEITFKGTRKGEESREMADLFLEKLGKFKSSQFDRTLFRRLFNVSEKKKIHKELVNLESRIAQNDNPQEVKDEILKSYERILARILSIDHREPKMWKLRNVIQGKKRELKANQQPDVSQLRAEVRALSASTEVKKSERELIQYIERKFKLREKKEIKSKMVNLMADVQTMEDPEEIRTKILLVYDVIKSDLKKTMSGTRDEELGELLTDIQFKQNNLRSIQTPTKAQLIDLLKYDVLEAKTNAKIARMNLLFQLGISGSSEKGVTGTILVKDLRGRILGVFKPDGSYASPSTKLGDVVRKIFGQLSLLSHAHYAQPTAEYASYAVDRYFGIRSVPSSKLVSLGGAKGVFQLAAGTVKKTRDGEAEKSTRIGKRLNEAKDVTAILNKEQFTEAELEIFQRFAIQDYLIGNLDAHLENWFVDTNSKGEITGIVGIDKANSWPVQNPNVDDRRSHNQYAWKEMGIANKPFTEPMRELMRSITKEKLELFFSKLERENPDFLTNDMKRLALERARAIRVVADNPESTPADLGAIIADAQFDELFVR